MVQRETIERICADVTRMAEGTIEAEFDRFFAAQAPVCDFLMETLAEGSQRGRELALFLSYVSFKAMSIDSGLKHTVDAAAIQRAGEDARGWLEEINEFDLNAPAARAATGEDGIGPLGDEPYLVSFVAAEIEDADRDDAGLEDVEKGRILLALQTVILSMTRVER